MKKVHEKGKTSNSSQWNALNNVIFHWLSNKEVHKVIENGARSEFDRWSQTSRFWPSILTIMLQKIKIFINLCILKCSLWEIVSLQVRLNVSAWTISTKDLNCNSFYKNWSWKMKNIVQLFSNARHRQMEQILRPKVGFFHLLNMLLDWNVA